MRFFGNLFNLTFVIWIILDTIVASEVPHLVEVLEETVKAPKPVKLFVTVDGI